METIVATTHIHELPDEVVCLIFANLPVEHLVHSVQHVCQRWFNLSQDWTLWKTYIFRASSNMTENQIIAFLEGAPMLRSFEAEITLKNFDRYIGTICDFCPNIQNLMLYDDNRPQFLPMFLGSDMKSLLLDHRVELLVTKVFKHLKNIESFTFTPPFWFSSRNVFECIAQSSTLKSLVISGCRIFEEKDDTTAWKLLADGMPALEKMTIITPMRENITVPDLAYMLERKREKLTSLGLIIPYLNDDHISIILQFEKLESLQLETSCMIEEDLCLNRFGQLSLKELWLQGFPHGIRQLLLSKSWTKLLKLNLSGSYASTAALDVIPKQCPILNTLKLDSTIMAPEITKDFYKMCHLKHITLRNAIDVTDKTVRDIALCPNLVSVDLSNCTNLTDGALHHLLACTNLKEIRMNYCTQVTGKLFHLIPTRLPHLKILSLYCVKNISIGSIQNLRAEMANLELII